MRVTVRDLVDAPMTTTTALDSDGTYAPPADSASWYAVGEFYANQKPGAPGVSIIGGHISYNGEPGTFYNLTRAEPGDVIQVTYDSGDLAEFAVTKVVAVRKIDATDITNALGEEIWNPGADGSVIRLITCDPATPFASGHYDGNLVVFGDRIN